MIKKWRITKNDFKKYSKELSIDDQNEMKWNKSMLLITNKEQVSKTSQKYQK